MTEQRPVDHGYPYKGDRSLRALPENTVPMIRVSTSLNPQLAGGEIPVQRADLFLEIS
jgi:hypothetical protein